MPAHAASPAPRPLGLPPTLLPIHIFAPHVTCANASRSNVKSKVTAVFIALTAGQHVSRRWLSARRGSQQGLMFFNALAPGILTTPRSTSLIDIENRIKRMESLITASGLDTQSNSVAASSPAASDSSLTNPIKLTDRLSTLMINENGKTRFLGGSSGFSLFSPQGLEWITQKTGSDELSRFIHELVANVQTRSDKTTAELYRPPFASEREPLPPKHIADRYVDSFFESYNKLIPLYDRAAFDQNYELQYSGHPPSGPAWYASLNTVLCLGCLLLQVRARSNAADNPENRIWKKYLRNASGCLLDLLFGEASLEAIQALIGMAVVQQVNLEPQAVYMLVAAAGRLAYGIGLHRSVNDSGLSEVEILQRQNLFWVVYIMDKSIALRLGHPSVMNDDDIGIDLPLEKGSGEVRSDSTTTRAGMFRYNVQLARLESRIYSALYSARGQTKSPMERMRLVGELDKAVVEWKEHLPVEIRPETPIQCQEDLVLPIVLMHFAYFNCLTLIHRASVHHGSWTSIHHNQHTDTVQDDGRLNPRVYASHAICLAVARQSIQLLNLVDFETRAVGKSSLWMLLYHPISNFLTLFANTLQNPQDPQAVPDLRLMDTVISLLSEPAFHVNVATTNTAQLFIQLSNVARKLVERTNSGVAKPTKRSRDEYDPRQDNNSQISAQDFQVYETLPESEISRQQSCSTISFSIQPHIAKGTNNVENLTTSSLDSYGSGDMFQQHISNPPVLFYPSDPIEGDLFAMSDTLMIPNSTLPYSDHISFAPITTDYFEWNLANLWSFGQSS
ncbi:conserved hypothetical protein [Talaromyces stipitatus ATCC 10500]|uniref:Xylanolytic transcriptional activator regulatory domain-containing protein n=1 Tax=Talaromyces stipitatus (strain ATCC 10500 / CBS 375.48 / QM 6759 / NRRL 1006) TaxID=441959 RepID=B8M0J3_TALSN|nr:uncharacterized protein TSTA_085210 [Talaromyces stipitatus ATCC 10500]EED21290.1 conserved hypothetical protein [Talaromyces stipitatus ATCC 10500]